MSWQARLGLKLNCGTLQMVDHMRGAQLRWIKEYFQAVMVQAAVVYLLLWFDIV